MKFLKYFPTCIFKNYDDNVPQIFILPLNLAGTFLCLGIPLYQTTPTKQIWRIFCCRDSVLCDMTDDTDWWNTTDLIAQVRVLFQDGGRAAKTVVICQFLSPVTGTDIFANKIGWLIQNFSVLSFNNILCHIYGCFACTVVRYSLHRVSLSSKTHLTVRVKRSQRTADCRPGIKCSVRIKRRMQTADYYYFHYRVLAMNKIIHSESLRFNSLSSLNVIQCSLNNAPVSLFTASSQ